MKPDADLLREIGESSTNVETSWGGAATNLTRGLNAWTRSTIGRDREIAVRAAIVSCSLVADHYSSDRAGLPPRKYVDDMLGAIRHWLDEPTRDNTETVRALLDITRSAHAWQHGEDLESFWILEAVDHASLAVWSGERASYIVPMDYATCAARSVACVLQAMLGAGVAEADAVASIVDAVCSAAE